MNRVLTSLPVLFSFRATLFGPAALIEVRIFNGRALYLEADDEGWLYGVNPGGMAAPGASFKDAHDGFRETLSKILVDLLLPAKSVAEYRAAVARFVAETNESYAAEWNAAVRIARATGMNATGLPTASAESPLRVEVLIRRQAHVSDNVAESDVVVAA